NLYLIAKGGRPTVNAASGDNPAIVLMTVLGGTVPANAVINEMTTVASVWTHAQFLNDDAIRGNALGLRIAAGNVPNFVDLQTGGWGGTIQDPLNSSQTPTMANFATLANVLSGCVTRATADACSKLFAAATPPKSAGPPAPHSSGRFVQSLFFGGMSPSGCLLCSMSSIRSLPARPCVQFRSCHILASLQALGSCR